MDVYLVCEGHRGGLDERVLDAIVVQVSILPVLISPVGGSSGLGSIRAYLEGRSKGDIAITVEDRDYRAASEAETTWTNPTGRAFMWRRHEIENYLLHPRVVLAMFNDLRSDTWAAKMPSTEQDVDTLLQSIAKPLLANHAGEILRREIVQHMNTLGSVSFSFAKPSTPAGAHAPGASEWLATLEKESIRLRDTCGKVGQLDHLQAESITARYTYLTAQYQSQSFLTSGDYLRDMGGHELLGQLSRHMITSGAPAGFNQKAVAEELLATMKKIYLPNTLFLPDDFSDLVGILQGTNRAVL